jgi:hypothetical protein
MAAEMKFLRRKIQTDIIKNENIKENLKIKVLEDKLIYNRTKLYVHVLRMNKYRILKNVLNIKLRRKHPRFRPRHHR